MDERGPVDRLLDVNLMNSTDVIQIFESEYGADEEVSVNVAKRGAFVKGT